MSIVNRLKVLLGMGRRTAGNPPPGRQDSGEARPISCLEALERVYEYLDGELEGATERDVAHHFSICKNCYPHLKLEERFLALLHSAQAVEEASPRLRSQVLEMLETEANRTG